MLPRSTPSRATTSLAAIAASALLVVVAACDTNDGRQLEEPTASQRASMPTTTIATTTTVAGLPMESIVDAPPSSTASADPFTLTAPWADGGSIDARFTCDGDDRSPTLTWTAPPAGTVELALVVTDDDAEDFVHLAVVGIPPTAGEVGEGGQITGATEGINGFGEVGWGGPCPPQPGESHTYRWTLYALAQQSEMPTDFTGLDVLTMSMDTGFTSAQVTGSYARAA